jgi:WhiB family redox-sensing transcriptional regulator
VSSSCRGATRGQKGGFSRGSAGNVLCRQGGDVVARATSPLAQRRRSVATSGWQLDEWNDQALHDFTEAAMRSLDPLPDLSLLLQRPAWQHQAACRGRGVEDFFPPDGSSRIRAALQCARCPVAKECLDYALEHPSLKGIWAGTSERARNRMRASMSENRSRGQDGEPEATARPVGRLGSSTRLPTSGVLAR